MAKITAEEQAVLDQYIEKYTRLGFPTERITAEKCYRCTTGLYELMGIKHPGIQLFEGPGDCWAWVCDQIGEQIEFIFPPYTGCMQMALVAVAEYLINEQGRDVGEAYHKFKPITELTMVWAMEDVCMCTQPPLFYHHDADWNLHCVDGPAMEWADGSKVWCIDGIDVDEQIVMKPQTQTIQQMVNESNTDVRAIRIDRYGWLPFLEQTKAVVLEEGENIIEGTYEALFSSQVGNRLVATCNTGRIITLMVTQEIRTLSDARNFLQRNRKFNMMARS